MARRKAPKGKKKKPKGGGGSSKGSTGGGSAGFGTQTVWRAGVDPIEEGEELSYDPTAYECLHRFRFSWPCLSFDVAVDGLGEREKTQFPYECTVVAGTQAGDPNENAVCLARLSNVCQGKHGAKRKSKKARDEDGAGDEMDMEMDVSSSDSESDSEEEEGEQPYFSAVEVHHRGGINRIRCLKQQGSCIVASWGETGHVQVWDLSSHMKMLSEEKIGPRTQKNKVKQVHQTPLHIAQHAVEGYALDWSRTNSSLLTGDCSGKIMLTRHDGTLVNWQTDSQGFAGHSASVEDLQWSPAEDSVFASCSVDKTIKIWDTRQRGKPGLSYEAHETDINVISWNSLTSCMIASGGDDGTMRIWDMRFISNKQYVANFDYCKKAITSIEWSPYEGSMVATSSADNQICFWDLSVERDAAEEVEHINAAAEGGEVEIPVDIPPQLLFVHGGQDNVKEVHWHEQIKGAVVSTAYDGFNIFAAANI
ncbi:WD40 repeat domain-containing protein [Chloropicon primus]|uniref:Glutamate-rich WD repeat-containing protein 1 n=1 Tax=Chloropicon primus TaxID=1764295 RepID=A0A5B8MU73_9CHLO|nr:WD40 repeat domain-containing protein [Chloropicon primus]UPR02207.1 WD40 repeat domain-containing protein [Chloropicon primus]|eukprot:QDZ22990.1 WD40 repeat domain-containing protein [Chloropicon primus]